MYENMQCRNTTLNFHLTVKSSIILFQVTKLENIETLFSLFFTNEKLKINIKYLFGSTLAAGRGVGHI